MEVVEAALSGVLVIAPRVYEDARGFFYESYNRRKLAQLGVDVEFVQDNHSRSSRNVLRGLHYQIRQPQGKLIRVVAGEVFDVAVDLRRSSATFGCWFGARLSAGNRRMMWVPGGFAHGFLTLSDRAEVLYKASDYYAPEHERCIRWDDADIRIEWPLEGDAILSEKDRAGVPFREAECFA
jgi:dTDP-4-dehydrorhamnose 3,5-epimerase